MDIFPYIAEEDGEFFYVKENSGFQEQVPLVDIFIQYEIEDKLPVEIAGQSGSLEPIEYSDVHKAAYFWTKNEVYDELEREANAIEEFNTAIENGDVEDLIKESTEHQEAHDKHIHTIETVFEDLIENDSSPATDFYSEKKEESKLICLELGSSSKVLAETDSSEYVDISHRSGENTDPSIKVNLGAENSLEQLENRLIEVYNSAVFSLNREKR